MSKYEQLVSKPILFDLEELRIFDEIVGTGNRSMKVRELVREFNEKEQLKLEEQLKLGE